MNELTEEQRRQGLVDIIMRAKHPRDPLTAVQARFAVDVAHRTVDKVQDMLIHDSGLLDEPSLKLLYTALATKLIGNAVQQIEEVMDKKAESAVKRMHEKNPEDPLISALMEQLGLGIVAEGDGFVVLGK